MDYAGFWMRFIAFIIDFVVLMIVLLPAAFVFGTPEINLETGATSYNLPNLVLPLVSLIYCAGFEASAKQATPGKMALGLIVTDPSGARVSYLRAAGRFVLKLIMLLVFLPGVLGIILAAFTPRKQGLQDMLTKTVVVRGKPGLVGFDPDEFA